MAVLSLGLTCLGAVAVVIFLVHFAAYVVAGILGLLLAIGGGWWTISQRMPRRALGIGGLAVGGAIILTALLRAGGSDENLVVRLAVTGSLFALAIITGRAAVAGDLRQNPMRSTRRRSAPKHPVLLCNPWSGGGKVERFGLVELASSLGIETVLLDHGLDLEQLARDAISRGADCLGMAGGDGSQALVASIAVEHDLPFVCVSAGTRNHFALDLGLDREDPRKSLHAFRDAVERRVDYSTVNGRFFVNNVSLGIYATIVQQAGYRGAKAETSLRLLPELLGEVEEPFDLEFVTPDGTEVNGSYLIMVSNNPYVLGASRDAAQRRRLDSGKLGVFAVTARTGAQAAAVVSLALAGQAAKSGHAFEFATEDFEVRSRSGKAYAGIDGEALDLATPLRFDVHPGGLGMLVPEGNIELAVRRESHDVRLEDLVSIVKDGSRSDELKG